MAGPALGADCHDTTCTDSRRVAGRNTGGSLDGLIDDWHALFGLPDGIRDELPRDELRYAYVNAAGDAFDFRDGAGGLGDIRLSAGYRLRQDEGGSLSLRAAVELPTGDEGKLTGNGAADYSLGIAWERSPVQGSGRWSTHLVAGVIRFVVFGFSLQP